MIFNITDDGWVLPSQNTELALSTTTTVHLTRAEEPVALAVVDKVRER